MSQLIKQVGIAALFGAGVAWGTTQALLAQKVDKNDFAQVAADIKATREDVQKVVRYLCKQDPSMLGCQ